MLHTSRWTIAALALAIALAGGSFSVFALTPPAGTTPPAVVPVKTGTVVGKVLDKDGKPAANVTVTARDPNAQGRGAGAGGGAGAGAAGGAAGGAGAGGRNAGGRAAGGRGGVTATTDDKGAFTLKNVPVGKVNVMATLTAADGTRQRGQTAAPVEVTEGKETKLTEDIKLTDAPARGNGGGAGGGAGGTRGGRGNRGAGGAGGGAGGAGQ